MTSLNFYYTALTALTVIHGFKIALETVFNFVGSLLIWICDSHS